MESELPFTAEPLRVRIGDVTLALSSDDPGLTLAAEGPVRHFLVAEGDPDVRLRVARSASCEPAPAQRIFDAGMVWALYRHGDGYQFRFRAPAWGAEPYRTATFGEDFTSGEIRLRSGCFPTGRPVYPLAYPLDELLMVNLLARGRGVEVHGCGVADADGRGHLFLGQSGAGKSTMARLWKSRPGVGILSDDRIILRTIDSRLFMYGTPWHGEAELASARRTPVDSIRFLARGGRNEIAALGEAEAVMRLMACSFVPFHDAAGIEFALTFLQQAAAGIGCAEYRFVPDERAVDFVREKAA
jgi:hypothetical protein